VEAQSWKYLADQQAHQLNNSLVRTLYSHGGISRLRRLRGAVLIAVVGQQDHNRHENAGQGSTAARFQSRGAFRRRVGLRCGSGIQRQVERDRNIAYLIMTLRTRSV